MSLLTNSENTYAQIGRREDLSDIAPLIDPQETPLISNIGTREKATSTKHEWQVKGLTAPSKTNFQLEGDDNPSAAAVTPRVRIYNYCAISKKVGAVSGTASAVTVAGISNELDEQKMLKAIELKRDMEVIALDNNAFVSGSAGTARECAGIAAYITNTDPTGTDLYSVSSGDGVTAWNFAATTTRVLSLTILNGAMLETHKDGGKTNMLMVSPQRKQEFSNLTLQSTLGGGAVVRYNLDTVRPGALIGTVDTWLSNFGQLEVMSNVQMSTDTSYLNKVVYLIDTRYAGLSYLRPMFTEPLAKTGDNDKFEVLAEWTLVVDAPKAHALLYLP